ncbi:LuxR C-terminal-related transcriptional regulator [Oscillatoria sp. CS-180]|uniref:LuxR C-terminal-related transcriptional regulator n=1 Tax=Oscillatoria sp. CS-180 TaxID=3021720 RepID=UPI002330FC3B|nr:LuxR C-terminal-related transcriptional regulator [Oscillatoria sp. CS-180]MDB9524842.1 LuxR C-terminal-related transcriptional regulator [Oscillatoria sp. CS-180]
MKTYHEDFRGMFNETRLVWDLQRSNQIAQSFSNSLDLDVIAHLATEGLVQYFDCAFARVWLVEPDRKQLQLIASSGLYTQINGSFSRIPMGQFKIGRIAQNRVSLLSNNLAEESWIRYPEWAIENKIRSFAGYPLANSGKVIGVLAAFGYEPMSSEFLEVLSSFCTTLTVALATALLHQKESQTSQAAKPQAILSELSLPDSLAHILGQTSITVLGTERSLDLSQTQVFLKLAEGLKALDCTYCRLTYDLDSVSLEAIAAIQPLTNQAQDEWERSTFGNLSAISSCFGGAFRINTEASIKAIQISLTFPTSADLSQSSLRIQCRLPLLQTGFTQLAYAAGFKVETEGERHIPLLTDHASLLATSDYIIWVSHTSKRAPSEAKAQVNLSTTASELQAAVAAVMRGDTWGLDQTTQGHPKLSQREQEVMTLLAKGLRDREIADQLYISDSTVKFHINNILAKLASKTRMQALYTLMRAEGLEL